MKTKNIFFTLIALGIFNSSFGQIDFPDPIFKDIVRSFADANGDGEITIQEAQNTSAFGITHYGRLLTNLSGIEHFTNLTHLTIPDSKVKTIDLSQNTALTHVNVRGNILTSINVNNLDKLKNLYVSNNELSSINIDSNTSLEEFDIEYNKLTSIDVSNNKQLKGLSVIGNLLSSLDVRNCNLTHLSFSNNPNLKFAYLTNQPFATTVEPPFTTTFSTVTYVNCPELEFICVDDVYVQEAIDRKSEAGYSDYTVNTDCSANINTNAFYTLFSLTPNPASDYIFLIRRHQRVVITGNITIRTLSGQLVKTVAPNDQGKPSRSSNSNIDDVEQRIDIQDLSSNQQYIITVPIRDGVVSAIFLKQ